jgi:hypothetical protein
VNWPLILCYVAGLPIELVLHNVRTFGTRSVGPRIVMALLLMLVFVWSHPQDDCRPLISFLIAVVPLSIIAQVSAMLRQWRGERTHTRYNGRPYLMWILPWCGEVTIKRLEPFVMLVVGWGVHIFNHPLGAFLITAALGLGVRVGIEHRVNCARAMDVNDSIIEQTIAADTVRRMQRR